MLFLCMRGAEARLLFLSGCEGRGCSLSVIEEVSSLVCSFGRLLYRVPKRFVLNIVGWACWRASTKRFYAVRVFEIRGGMGVLETRV